MLRRRDVLLARTLSRPGHMKNLTGVLVFSLTLLLSSGCRKNSGEAPPPADAARMDSGTAEPATGKAEGAVRESSDEEGGKVTLRRNESIEKCVDRWLKANKLDRYGHPEGTMYAGGTPLFNEATGETRDRVSYVFERHPEADKACVPTGPKGE